jgi:hypothetical protein
LPSEKKIDIIVVNDVSGRGGQWGNARNVYRTGMMHDLEWLAAFGGHMKKIYMYITMLYTYIVYAWYCLLYMGGQAWGIN